MKKIILILTLSLSHNLFSQECYDFNWAVKGSGGYNVADVGNGVAVDVSGNIYVTGSFQGTATFGSITLMNSGGTDIFIAKLNPQGQYLWAVKAGGSGADVGNDIAVDASGNSYVTGTFSGTATFGSATLTSSGNFTTKLNSQGQFLWTIKEGGKSITMDTLGNSYVLGNSGNSKINSQGQTIWSGTAGGASSSIPGNGIGIRYSPNPAADNLYIVGQFSGTKDFVSNTLTSSGGSSDIFILKSSTASGSVWAVKAGGSGQDIGKDIAVEPWGDIYITGQFEGTTTFGSTTLTSSGGIADVFIAKLNPQGQFLWVEKAGGSGYDVGNSIVVDASGNSYVTGSFEGTATFGTTTLTSSGSTDIFIAKLNSQGQFVWAKKVGGNSAYYTENGNGIAVDASGNSYVTGQFLNTATFGSTTLTSSGGNTDVFITKLSPTTSSLSTSATNIVCGNTVQLQASGNNPNTVYSWSPSNTLTDANTTSPTAKPINTTTYTVTATTPSGCVAKDSATITVNPYQVTVSPTNNLLTCGNSRNLQATLSASVPNISYSWSPSNSLTGENTANPTAKPISTTTYTVTATTPNGCLAQDTITIIVNPYQVNASATNTLIECGSSTPLYAHISPNVSNISYSWSPSNSLIGTTAKPTSTTTYTVTATTSNGCLAQDTITITVNPYQVNASATKTLISCGGSTELHATSNNSNAVYSWSPSSSLTNANTANPAASPTSTTTYTVSSSVTGCGTATGNITITVGAYTPQLFTSTSNELTATFTNNDENAVSYAWDFGDGNTSTSENPTHTYATDGTYNVCLTLTNTCSETETVCANVTVTKEVGVQNIAAQATWSVYPNPTNSTFTVANAPNGASLSITDLSGKTVYTSRIVSEQTSIETTTFTSGIYFVNVMFEGVTTMHKVVVTK